MATVPPTHHIAAMLLPAWGHTISYIHAATQMLITEPGLVITIVQHDLVVPKMEAELKGQHDNLKARLRIIGVGDSGMDFGASTIKVATEQLVRGWMDTIVQLAKGNDGWPKPRAIHLDFACGDMVIERTKQILGPACKTLLWFSCPVSSMTDLSNYDYLKIAEGIYADPLRRDGRSLEAIVQQVVAASNGTDQLSGRIIKFPGAPDMYDHERHAYAAGPPLAGFIIQGQNLAGAVDGLIVTTSRCLEPVGVPYCRELYAKRGQELFAVGMQAHELCWTDSAAVVPSNERVRSFLDRAVREYGPKSVLYISFGSFFFPVATPQLVEALLDTLLTLESPFPFIFSLGGQMASLPADLIQRVSDSGKGLICDFWVEQRALLQHGAVGWFLTHGGFNSVSESLTQGIPLIIWPVGAEQPINAAFLSAEPSPVAIELFQVRTSTQLGPSLHSNAEITGTVQAASEEFKATFAAAREMQGAILRANAEKMALALREARVGEASEEFRRLINF
ncbi:hypothetical protein DFH08DRAFT_977602 [Mycena albidolilacea]|uniref:Glycosyltransferase n=1 Tax=Mycena albidolilacea TaxID=1033008 RepID=A0AAD7E8A9_9AGAR|nr:hypothetical protein DFH08DRAFT_977602 [Mycena albidolilacea]